MTCTAQSSYLTGLTPAEHGIVGNGWYDRDLAEIHFWKQSNHLVRGPKLWDKLRAHDASFTCAQLFWWYNMHAAVDWSITPRPLYPADGRKIFDIHTGPLALRPEIKKDLGEFPFPQLLGPGGRHRLVALDRRLRALDRGDGTSPRSISFICRISTTTCSASARTIRRSRTTCAWSTTSSATSSTFSTSAGAGRGSLRVRHHRGRHAGASQPRFFRRHGWLAIKDELGLETLDCGASRASSPSPIIRSRTFTSMITRSNPQVRAALEAEPGVERVLDARRADETGHPSRAQRGFHRHRQAAQLVHLLLLGRRCARARLRAHGRYPSQGRLRSGANSFSIRNCAGPSLRIAAFLLRKKLGLRGLLNVIPLDATLVRGSHGRLPENENDWPIMITDTPILPSNKSINAREIHDLLLLLLLL